MPGLAGHFTHVDNYHERNFGAVHQLFLQDRKQNWSPRRKFVSGIVESSPCDAFMGVVISFNTVMVLLETDITAKDEAIPSWMYIVSLVMIFIYTVELILRLFAYRSYFFKNGWNIFDFAVVSSDLVSEFINVFLADMLPISTSMLKIFRLGRLLRFVCVLTMFEDLNKMITLMLASLSTLLWGFFLVTCMTTGWSIIAVQFLHPVNSELAKEGHYADCERCARAFESVAQSNLTFFQQLVFGDSWGTICVKLVEHAPWTAIILVAAGITVQIGLLNLILTVIVDKATLQNNKDAVGKLKAKATQFEAARDGLDQLTRKLDKDGNGYISIEELQIGFEQDPEFAAIISLMDLNESDLAGVYAMLDVDRSGFVTREEVVEELYKMKTQDLRAIILHIKGKQVEDRCELQRSMKEMMEYVKQCSAVLADTSTKGNNTRQDLPSPWSKDSIDNGAVKVEDPLRLALREEIPQLLLTVGQRIESQMAAAINKAINENGVIQQLPAVYRDCGKRDAANHVQETVMKPANAQRPASADGILFVEDSGLSL